ncbi:tetraacyldisaccharide 4'-kinase [Petrachloros mirabilis]
MLFAPGSRLRWWLLWAAIPYGFIAGLRAKLYRWGWLAQRKLPVPVISIGNLTLGGTGKTPIVIRLAEWLLADGKRVAILSRGYRRTSVKPKLLVSDGERLLTGPGEAGDEPYLIASRCPKAIVAVGPDRYELGRWVLSQFPVDCILLDDGFQHLALYRDVDLLLVDATDLSGLEAVVPAGRLREPIFAARRATMIIVTRADIPDQVARVIQRLCNAIGSFPDPVQVVFRADQLIAVASGEPRPLSWCRGKSALLCSGIGHTASFRALAESLGFRRLDEIGYPDHHPYTTTDIDRLRTRAREHQADLVLTTEKDAGKLAPLLTHADRDWGALRLQADIVHGHDELRRLLLGAGESGTRRGVRNGQERDEKCEKTKG